MVYAQLRGSAEMLPPPYALSMSPRTRRGHRISAMRSVLFLRRASARRALALRCPVSKEHSTPSFGRQFINMPHLFDSANRQAVFFAFFRKKVRLRRDFCLLLSAFEWFPRRFQRGMTKRVGKRNKVTVLFLPIIYIIARIIVQKLQQRNPVCAGLSHTRSRPLW